MEAQEASEVPLLSGTVPLTLLGSLMIGSLEDAGTCLIVRLWVVKDKMSGTGFAILNTSLHGAKSKLT